MRTSVWDDAPEAPSSAGNPSCHRPVRSNLGRVGDFMAILKRRSEGVRDHVAQRTSRFTKHGASHGKLCHCCI